MTAFVATPELLGHVGVDTSGIPADAEILSSGAGARILVGAGGREKAPRFNIAPPAYSSLPGAFITTAGMDKHNLQQVTVGWIFESPDPLPSARLSTARRIAAGAGSGSRLGTGQRHAPASGPQPRRQERSSRWPSWR